MLQETLEQGRQRTDAALDRLIPLETEHPESIHKAMRHSVFAGGKRLRPVLCMEAGRMVAGIVARSIEELGAALEMLHTYSLIHDDLPALDNDDLRRGRPTCHKVLARRSRSWPEMRCRRRPTKCWRGWSARPRPACALSRRSRTARERSMA
jgi:geranylgeranyl pyrophosphate synthase